MASISNTVNCAGISQNINWALISTHSNSLWRLQKLHTQW